MNRYVCIHGHFYQPPRENPWLEVVELQDTAYPYHDWNARVLAECYGPNAASRILDPERRIIDIVNNYSKISFNFGPTLLAWMERNNPEVYGAILEADKKSQELFSGHGSALAQAYNHMIMPLATSQDKQTQVIWGIKDFEYRFKRMPEGMWLPETAADLETLEILAQAGIKFTVLSPSQAKQTRKMDSKKWQDVSGTKVDPKMPYLLRLPSGKAINIFFYEGPASHEVAFNNLLDNGENFAKRLMEVFPQKDDAAQLVHIATDGETYGHHHRFGDMALTYCMYYLESNNLAKITIYGEFLEKFPPTYEVEISENSSWSCFHGVQRWRNNCGCNSGRHPGWNQDWRAPLRGAMDWLRDNLTQIFQEQAKGLFTDPWKARDDYIEVILNRSPDNTERFLSEHIGRKSNRADNVKALKLLEMQRNAMLMYTSCGWFFDEISGIETVQIIGYAARAVQLAEEVSGISLEEAYVNLLERAPSNVEEYKNGAKVYEVFVKPLILDLLRVGVHYAVSSLFKDYSESANIYSYAVKRKAYNRLEAGKQRLAVGMISMHSGITLEEQMVSFAVLHLGDHNIVGGARVYEGKENFTQMVSEIKEKFDKVDISEVIRLIDNNFSDHSYSLWHLFRDEQRVILDKIFANSLKEIEGSFRQIYERNYAIMQAMESLRIPLPKFFATIMEFIINNDIRQLFKGERVDFQALQKLFDETKRWSVKIDAVMLSFIASRSITGLMEKLSDSTKEPSLLEDIVKLLRATNNLSLELNLWKAQNIYFSVGKQLLDEMHKRETDNDESAKKWIKDFNLLGEHLKVRIE